MLNGTLSCRAIPNHVQHFSREHLRIGANCTGEGREQLQRKRLPMSVVAKRKRRQPRAVLREAILLAAQSAANRNCNREFSFVQISEILGISPSTIYEHFKNRDALVLAVGHRLTADSSRPISVLETGLSGHMTDSPSGANVRRRIRVPND